LLIKVIVACSYLGWLSLNIAYLLISHVIGYFIVLTILQRITLFILVVLG
jgi:hypothetical protein